MSKLSEYKKRKDFLVCVDSDGCAMDTMDIKHIRCFGPCMVAEWGLEEWKDEILSRWNDINLYTMTRGINRYKGLSIALTEINEKYTALEDLDTLTRWVDESPELSNGALEKAIAANDSISLKKALSWSKAVNASINQLPDKEKLPFEGVRQALAS
ncbi:MAG: HAD family hydrolase, partial [Acetatifactor sp.]|nr:HAD family hydrolase [Acetatifactor sp.]